MSANVYDESLASSASAPAKRLKSDALILHLLAALFVAAIFLLHKISPANYVSLMQEDRPIEWGTVWLFLAAGLFGLRASLPDRRWFDILVALFCLFVAFEEFSWGQRLLGYGSPEYFLANNYQQEMNLHNLPGAVVRPKWILILALAGFGILLPLLARFAPARRLLDYARATAPTLQLLPWFVLSIALLLWYPITLTGEWVEFLAGGLFLVSMRLQTGTFIISLSAALIFGVLMSKASGAVETKRDAERTACASIEAQKILDDIINGEAAGKKLLRARSVHKRVWTAAGSGHLKRENMREFDAAVCDDSGEASEARRRYAVDPWGMSYWIRVQKGDDGRKRIAIYSFGPNRRRDGAAGETTGDDVSAIGFLEPSGL